MAPTQGKGHGLPSGQVVGLLAQNVETVLPEVVSTSTTGFKSIAYGPLHALTVEALKEHVSVTAAATSTMHSATEQVQARVQVLEAELASKNVELAKMKVDLVGVESVGEALSKTVEEQATDLQAQVTEKN